MNLTAWGAAQQVTGSMHLLEVGQYKILIDCGIDHEQDQHVLANENFPFHPEEINLVVLTHAHIDHSGNLPTLVRMGFAGQIICTSATARLSELLMLDSVNIFLRKEQKKVKRNGRTVTFKNPPLYLQKHVIETVDRFITIPFNKPFAINSSVELTLIPMGHLLGAAAAVFHVIENGEKKSIAFTGDVGRHSYPILRDPETIPAVDYLVCEATYGGRFHSNEDIEERLTNVISDTCIKTPGKLIIPAFSIGRTQALIYTLNKLFLKRNLPPIKIFVDSPLANYATEIYRDYHHLLNDDAQDFYKKQGDQFSFEHLEYVETLDQSKQISNYYEPCIIVSSAGMLEGGRILDHLYQNIQNYYCTIFFIGYAAKGTLGHRLMRGDQVVKIKHRDLSVFARIEKTDALSGHADHNGLLKLIRQQKANQLKKLILVHGELVSMKALQDDLIKEGYETTIALKGNKLKL